MKRILIFIYFLCSLSIYSQNTTYIPADSLKSKTIDEIFVHITGNYVSSTQQTGWSPQKPFNNYGMTITKDHQILMYCKSSDTAKSYSFLYKLDLTLTNNNGYLKAESKMSDLNESNAVVSGFQGWLKGLFYISVDKKSIMFSNDIETDGGPATTWVRTEQEFK